MQGKKDAMPGLVRPRPRGLGAVLSARRPVSRASHGTDWLQPPKGTPNATNEDYQLPNGTAFPDASRRRRVSWIALNQIESTGESRVLDTNQTQGGCHCSKAYRLTQRMADRSPPANACTATPNNRREDARTRGASHLAFNSPEMTAACWQSKRSLPPGVALA